MIRKIEVTRFGQGCFRSRHAHSFLEKFMAELRLNDAALRPDEYAGVWGRFAGKWPEREWFTEWFGSIMVPHLARYAKLWGISVGAGPAQFDLELLRLIKTRVEKLHVDYTGIDPNPDQIQAMRANMAGAGLSDTVLTPHQGTWQDYEPDESARFRWGIQDGDRLPVRFNYQLWSHVLYYLFDREASLGKAKSLLSYDGVGVVFQQPPFGQHIIQRKFMLRACGSDVQMFSTQQTVDVLRRLGMACRHVQLLKMFDVQPCLDPTNQFGNAFIELTLEASVDRMDPRLVAEVREFIADTSCPTGDGQRLMVQPVGIVVFAHEDRFLPSNLEMA